MFATLDVSSTYFTICSLRKASFTISTSNGSVEGAQLGPSSMDIEAIPRSKRQAKWLASNGGFSLYLFMYDARRPSPGPQAELSTLNTSISRHVD